MRRMRWFSGPKVIRLIPRWLLLLFALIIAGVLVAGLAVKVELTVSVEGKLVPDQYCELRAATQGVIKQFLVTEGQQVDTGMVLCELDNVKERNEVLLREHRIAYLLAKRAKAQTELRSEILRGGRNPDEGSGLLAPASRVEYERARAALMQARESETVAQNVLEEGTIQLQTGAIPREEYDRRQQTYEEAIHKRLLAEAEARFAESMGNRASWQNEPIFVLMKRRELAAMEEEIQTELAFLRIAQDALDHTYLRAPFSGTVLTGELDRLIGKGVFSGTPIIAVGDLSRMTVRARLPETRSAGVEPGLNARVFLKAYPHTRYGVFEGTVVSVAPSFQTIDWEAKNVPEQEITPEMKEPFTIVTIALKEPILVDEAGNRHNLAPGLSGRADIILDEGRLMMVALRWLRRGYRGIPNLNLHL